MCTTTCGYQLLLHSRWHRDGPNCHVTQGLAKESIASVQDGISKSEKNIRIRPGSASQQTVVTFKQISAAVDTFTSVQSKLLAGPPAQRPGALSTGAWDGSKRAQTSGSGSGNGNPRSAGMSKSASLPLTTLSGPASDSKLTDLSAQGPSQSGQCNTSAGFARYRSLCLCRWCTPIALSDCLLFATCCVRSPELFHSRAHSE
jgi:hypothetical protein